MAAADEVNALQKVGGKWAPTSIDFKGIASTVAGREHTQIDGIGKLLDVIDRVGKRDKQIKRLNLITHANPLLIGLNGQVKANGNVFVSTTTPDSPLTSKSIDDAVLDKLRKLLDADTSGLLARVRTAFANQAAIWLYACHSGVDTSLVKQLAELFDVTIHGFADEIWYFPTFTATPAKVVERRIISVGSSETIAEERKVRVTGRTPAQASAQLAKLDSFATAVTP